MKGSLFPLGQPLRELEDRPRAGFVPRLQPCLLPVAVGVLGSWPPTHSQFPAPSPRGQPECRCPHTMVAPLPPLSSPVWHHDITEHEWGALVFGAGFCSLHTSEPCKQDAHKCHGELGDPVKTVLCPRVRKHVSDIHIPRLGPRKPLPYLADEGREAQRRELHDPRLHSTSWSTNT